MTVVVSGASSGIGKAVALELHRRGVSLVLSGRDESRLQAVSKLTGTSPFVAGDIANPNIAAELFARAQDGPIAAVFAAGASEFGPTLEFPNDAWQASIDANLTGLFNCCRAAIAAMLPGGGRIVNVLSIAAVHPFPNSAAYVATKAGALGLTRSLQSEFRVQGVYLTAFIPGSTATELWDHQEWSPEPNEMMQPDDVAGAICDIVLAEGSGVYDEVRFMPHKGIL